MKKVLSGLPSSERNIVEALAECESGNITEIMRASSLSKAGISPLRDRLLKKGILMKTSWGKIAFALPRFKEYILALREFE